MLIVHMAKPSDFTEQEATQIRRAVRELIEARGWTYVEAGRAFGCSGQWIGMVLSGKYAPPAGWVDTLLGELKMTRSGFFRHEGPFAEPPEGERSAEPAARTDLTPEENRRVREALEDLVATHKWSLEEAGRQLGLSYQQVGNVLRGRYGASTKVVRAVVGFLGVTEDQFFKRAGAFLAELPTWDEAVARAKTWREHGVEIGRPDWVYWAVGRWPAAQFPGDASDPEKLAHWLAVTAYAWWQHLDAKKTDETMKAYSRVLAAKDAADEMPENDGMPPTRSGETVVRGAAVARPIGRPRKYVGR